MKKYRLRKLRKLSGVTQLFRGVVWISTEVLFLRQTGICLSQEGRSPLVTIAASSLCKVEQN